MSKILVTGGAGFIGNNFVSHMLKKGHEIVIFDNGFRVGFSNLDNVGKKYEIINGDVSNFDDWEKIPNDIEYAYHFAAINGTKFFYEIPDQVINTNVLGTLNFVKRIRDTNVKKIFFASSSEIYGFPKIFPTPETEPMVIPDPMNARFSYSSSKIIGEMIIINFGRTTGIEYQIGRFHNIYGPAMGFEHVIPEFIRKIVKNEVFEVQGDGNESRCFCYISDAVKAIEMIMVNNGLKNEIFNIGIQKETTIKELINKLGKIVNKEISPVFKEFEKHGTLRRMPDTTKISKIGFEAKIDLETGLRECYNWYKKYFEKN